MYYHNPILSGFYPDPSICRVGDTFYMVNSSFEYFPAVPIFKSKNLVNWEQIGHCVSNEEFLNLEGCGNSKGIYAPTIRYHEGTFYVTTTDISGIRNFYVTAQNPEGPWSEPILVDFPGIDPSFFFEGTDTYYMSTSKMVNGHQTTLIGRINIQTGEIIGEVKELWSGMGGRYPEGPHLYKKDNWYYVLLAEGGTAMGHRVTMARSRNIWGPYEPYEKNPIYTHQEVVKTEIHGTGHMDLVEDQEGNWWAVFLGFRMRENYFHHLGRETFLAPVTWEENDFPCINKGKPITPKMETDLLPLSVQPINHSFIDEFKNKTLDARYNFLRKPSLVHYSLEEGLKIKGNGLHLNERGTPSWIGFRQTDFNNEVICHISTEFYDRSRVGLTVFYDNTRHFDLYYTSNTVEVYKRIDDMEQLVYRADYDHKEIVFYIKSDAHHYYFGYGENEEEARLNQLVSGLTRHLSTEMGIMSFTGVYFGMFVDSGTETTATIKRLSYTAGED